MKHFIKPMALFFLIIMSASGAMASETSQQSWSPEEIAFSNAQNQLKEALTKALPRMETLYSQKRSGTISEDAFREGTVVLLINVLEGMQKLLDTGVDMDRVALEELDRANRSSARSQKAMEGVLGRIKERMEKVKTKLAANSFGSIIESEIANAHGSSAVPYAVSTKLTEFNSIIEGTFTTMNDNMARQLAKLTAAGSNFDQVREIIQGSLDFKTNMSSAMNELVIAVSELQGVGKMPSFNNILSQAVGDTSTVNEGMRVIGILTTDWLNSVFGEPTDGVNTSISSGVPTPQDARSRARKILDAS